MAQICIKNTDFYGKVIIIMTINKEDTTMRKPAMIDGTMIILPPKEETPKTLTEREDGTYTYTDEWGTTTIYQDAAGEAVLGYEITYSWGSNKYTTTYNANWEMQSSISTEGNRTTEYGNVDGVWTLVSLTVDYGAMNAIEEDGYTDLYTHLTQHPAVRTLAAHENLWTVV